MLPNSATNTHLFGSANAKNSFSSPNSKPKSPPEAVECTFYHNQILVLKIPFSTARAAEIRNYMHTNILTDDGNKIFLFRQGSGWTNVSLDSTASHPKVTCDPTFALHRVLTFKNCPAVSTVTIKNGITGELVTTDEEIESIAFETLESNITDTDNSNEASSSGKTDAEHIMEHINIVREQVAVIVSRDERHSEQLSHIVKQVDALNRKFDALANSAEIPIALDGAEDEPPATSKAMGKRKARK